MSLLLQKFHEGITPAEREALMACHRVFNEEPANVSDDQIELTVQVFKKALQSLGEDMENNDQF